MTNSYFEGLDVNNLSSDHLKNEFCEGSGIKETNIHSVQDISTGVRAPMSRSLLCMFFVYCKYTVWYLEN